MTRLSVNGQPHDVDVETRRPLLWVLRDALGLLGYQIWLRDRGVRRLHGAYRRRADPRLLGARERGRRQAHHHDRGASHGNEKPCTRVQRAWARSDVPQCGYCQSGMIMAVAALLNAKPKPTDAGIDAAVTNICRCGTYQRIRAAIHAAAAGA